LKASILERKVILSWEESATHFDGFRLERSSDSLDWALVNLQLIDKSVRNFTDTADLPGSSWFYRICARADKNQSNYCYSPAVCLPPVMPDTISGPDGFPPFSRDLVYNILPVSGATSYIWSVPEDAALVSGQGTTRMVMHAGISGGEITVKAVNKCGESESRKRVLTGCSLPDNPGSISGKNMVEESSEDNIYSVSPANGAESYHWQVPPGASINFGQGTTKISVDFGNTNGFISVYSINNCGSSKIDSLAIGIISAGSSL
jgi:hypothetical protein